MQKEKTAATTAPKKRKIKKGFLAVYITIIVIAMVALILSVIPVSARVVLPQDDLLSVQIITADKYAWEGERAEKTVELIAGENTAAVDDLYKSYNQATSFSVGTAMMHNLWSYQPFKSEMTPKSVTDIKNLAASGSQKMVVYAYAKPQTVTIGKTEISYDRAFVFVSPSKQLITYSMYFVDSAQVLADNDVYTAQEYRGWIRSTAFCDLLETL